MSAVFVALVMRYKGEGGGSISRNAPEIEIDGYEAVHVHCYRCSGMQPAYRLVSCMHVQVSAARIPTAITIDRHAHA